MNVDELQNTLNRLINKNELSIIKATELSNELLETIKIIENCTSCKDKKIDGNDLDKIENYWRKKLNKELFQINIKLNKEILCESCNGKKIKKLTDKCG